MPTKYPEVFAALAAEFHPRQIRQRSQAGRQLSYITARVAANRLDEVLGPENWKTDYSETKDGIKCRIWFRMEEGAEWLWKENGGGFAGMSEEDNNEKSGYSDAFKRTAVELGVGRHLYQDGVPNFGVALPPVPASASSPAPQQRQDARHDAPTAPVGKRQAEHNERRNFDGKPPGSGRGMFAWCKEQEQKHEVGMLKYLSGWGKGQGYPDRMVDWNREQIEQAYQEGLRKIQATQPQPVTAGPPAVQDDDDIPF